MAAPRILLAGYYGFGNAGDEAILASVVAHLRELRPDAAITVVSGDPQETARTHGVEAVFWRDPLALEDAARQADLVVIGGGGLFHDYWGFPADAILTDAHWGLSYYAAPAALALLHEKPLMLYAVGVGPLLTEPGRQFTKAVCDAASSITVRDEDSRSELAALGVPPERVEVTADPAFAFVPPPDAFEETDVSPALPGMRPRLAVALRHWDVGVEPERWEAEVADALDRFLESTGGGALFLPFQQESVAIENDAAVAQRVRARMRRAEAAVILPGGSSPRRLAAAIGDCDLVLAMRMHAGLFGALAGIPVVSLDYDPKVSRFMKQIGQPDYAVRLGNVAGEGLAAVLSQAFDERGRYSRHLAGRVKGLAGLARRNAEVAIERLEAGASAPAATDGLVDLLRRTARSQFRAERGLTVTLGERDRSLSSLTSRLSEKEREAAGLSQALRAAEKRAEEETQRGQREAAFLQKQLSEVRNEILSIHTSRFWKILSIYWAAVRRLRRLFGSGGEERREGTGSAPSAIAAPSRARALPRAPSPAPLSAENLYDVLCLPIIDWDFRFQRPQQLMARFAAAGHRVFYVAQAFRPAGPPYEIRKKRENVWEVSLRGPARNVYEESLDGAARDALFGDSISCAASSRSERRRSSSSCRSGGRSRRRRARSSPGRSSTTAWTTIRDSRRTGPRCWTRRRSSSPARTSSSRPRCSSNAPRRKPTGTSCSCPTPATSSTSGKSGGRSMRGPSSATTARSPTGSTPTSSPTSRSAGPTGTSSSSARPTRPTRRRLSKLANVQLPGEKPYAEIPSWLARMDVAILPFKRLPLTEATSPVKAFEILAAGKPLVSVPIPEVVPMAPLVRLASTAEEFEHEIAEALAEDDPQARQRRQAFGRENTWQRRFETLAPAVRSLFPKASVVVVTFNNLALNRLCLESLYGRTDWPNFEVIVVDNASTDGTPEYLREAEARYPNLRAVCNETNRGFAAANNQGLTLATGDVLVLLNNDTVVTRGWLTALVRHLAADPTLGLIGPFTNAIANEAKIAVGYDSVEELPAWAASSCASTTARSSRSRCSRCSASR